VTNPAFKFSFAGIRIYGRGCEIDERLLDVFEVELDPELRAEVHRPAVVLHALR